MESTAWDDPVNSGLLLARRAVHPICHKMYKRQPVGPGGSVVERGEVAGRRKVTKTTKMRGSPAARHKVTRWRKVRLNHRGARGGKRDTKLHKDG